MLWGLWDENFHRHSGCDSGSLGGNRYGKSCCSMCGFGMCKFDKGALVVSNVMRVAVVV